SDDAGDHTVHQRVVRHTTKNRQLRGSGRKWQRLGGHQRPRVRHRDSRRGDGERVRFHRCVRGTDDGDQLARRDDAAGGGNRPPRDDVGRAYRTWHAVGIGSVGDHGVVGADVCRARGWPRRGRRRGCGRHRVCPPLGGLGPGFARNAAGGPPLGERVAGGVVLGLGVLVVSYLLRGAGAVLDNPLTWLSPLGWAEEARAFGDTRWWPVLVSLGVAVLLVVVAAVLRYRRDLGSAALRRGGSVPAAS